MLLTLVLLAPHALNAQSVDSVTPAEGTVGTVLTIDGAGFGPFKPKVWLASDEAPQAKRPLGLFTATDGRLRGVIQAKALPEGTYRVFVEPKGSAGTIVSAPIFEAVPPQIDDFQPKQGPPGATVVLSGSQFGTRKGQVFHGDTKVKVLSWRDDRITVRLKPTGSGLFRVRSRTGEAESFCSFGTILDVGPPPAPFLDITGDLVDYAYSTQVLRARLDDRHETLTLAAFTQSTAPKLVELSLQVQPGVDHPYPTSLVSIDHVRVTDVDGGLSGAQWTAVSPPSVPQGIQGQAGVCKVKGKLDVVLVRTAGSGPDELSLHMEFVLDVGAIELPGE